MWKRELEVATHAAKEAGEFLHRNLGKQTSVSYKGEIDLVTEMDKKAQELIIKKLSSFFPSHDFMAEEDFSKIKGSDYRWIIDPLDGTTNYAHGLPIYCISIALEEKKEIVLGIVFFPPSSEIFSASKKRGAFLNGKKLCVSNTKRLERSLIATGFPYDVRTSPQNNINHFNHFVTKAQAIRRCGSAALDLCYVACGRFDGFWELKLNPWDVAAGALIVEEAGGKVTDFKGNDFDLYGQEILASNGNIHKEMVQVLTGEKY